MTREVYTPTYAAALDRVAGWMREVGLDVRLDAVGNLFGRWDGTEPGAPRVLTGSHVDTTLNAGRYDGVARRARRDRGRAAAAGARACAAAPIELVAWAGEEPRFGTGCVGSRAAAGAALPRRPRPAARPRRASRWPRRCARRASTPTGWPRPRSTRRPCTRSSSCTSSRARCSRRRATRSAW